MMFIAFASDFITETLWLDVNGEKRIVSHNRLYFRFNIRIFWKLFGAESRHERSRESPSWYYARKPVIMTV